MATGRRLIAGAAGAGDVGRLGRRHAGLLCVGALVGVAAARILLGGWAGVAPDDARYVHVGLNLLDGHGPLTADGTLFLLRSPAYGAVLATGSRLLSPLNGGDVLAGARIVAAALMVAGLVAAVRLAWVLGGRNAAVATTGALIATPLIWRLVPTLRVDLVQTAGILAVLLLLQRPSLGRWTAAGAVLGLTILVKESALLLAALPVAWLEGRPTLDWARRTAAYVGAATLVAAWWWVVVWSATGALFPANALSVIEARRVGTGVDIDRLGAALLVVIALSWAVVAAAGRRTPGTRSLLLTAALLGPPAIYAFANGLDARNYAGLAVLSAVAVGLAAARVLRRLAIRPAALVARPSITLAAGSIAAAALIAFGQLEVGNPAEASLPGHIAAWLTGRLAPGEAAAMTFRHRALVALELYGRAAVPELRPDRVVSDADPGEYLWIGLRDRDLFGYRRSTWAQILGDPRVRYLVVVEPHFFAPVELEPFLASSRAGRTGVQLVERLEPGDGRATIHAVDPLAVGAGVPDIPLHVTAEAALAWIDLAPSDGAARLARALPIVAGDADAIRIVVERLGGDVCPAPAGAPWPEPWLRLAPAGGDAPCPAR